MPRLTSVALTCVFLILLTGPAAWAIKDPETSVVFPDTSRCGGAAAKAAAVGVREATMGIDVYAVVLYINPRAAGKSVRATSACVKLRARFVRTVGADKVRGAWVKGFKKYGLAITDPTAKKFLAIIAGKIKKGQEMVMTTKGATVIFKYAGARVTIPKAGKLASVVKKVYLGSGSPTPTLVKDLRKRGVAKP